MRPLLIAILLTAALAGCDRSAEPPREAPAAAPPAAYAVGDWALPTPAGAAQPDLAVAPDGRMLLSWIEPAATGHVLKLATYDVDAAARASSGAPAAPNPGWSPTRTIAAGANWFVNWADTPHVAATADGALWAHWLQKSAAATYAYDVALVRSADDGATWSAPVLVNDDGTATEHGFVSLWPVSHDSLGVAWLDGRRTAAGSGHAAHGAAAPAAMMTLRSTRFDAGLQRGAEHVLDLSTCDCCQTDAVPTAGGALLAYRDRTAAEIRDIYVARLDGDTWQPGARVHADDWMMPACPVNGPSIAARGDAAIIGWYTVDGGMPTVKLARSSDGGASFAAPITLDSGEAVQGRVDVAFGADAAWVLWLREAGGRQSLQLARFAPDLSHEWQRIEVAVLQGRGRGTGFPQLALAGDGAAYVLWTDVVDGRPSLHGARIAVPQDAAPTDPIAAS